MQGRDQLIADLGCDYPFLDYAWLQRIACAYGTRAWDWLGTARNMDGLGTHFGHGLTEAELRYLVEREWAATADDILWRRTKLGLRLDAQQTARLEQWLEERA